MLLGWCQVPGSLLDILRFFEQYPGDIVYYLVIIALAQVSLFFAFSQRRRFPDALTTQRFFFAASTLLCLWIIILVAATIALLTPNAPGSLLPPLERLAQTLSVTIFAWALLAADEDALRRPGNLSALGMVLIVLLFFAYTAYQWYTTYSTGDEFNASVFAPVWSAMALAIAVAALLLALLYATSLEDAPLKSLFFLFIVLGNGWDLYQVADGIAVGNYLGGARLAYMGALSIVPLVLYRQAITLLTSSQVEGASAYEPLSTGSHDQESASHGDTATEQKAQVAAGEMQPADSRMETSAALLASIGMILGDDEDSTIPQRAVKTITSALKVELCLFLRRLDSNYAELTAGYDAVSQNSFSGSSFNLDALPALRQAFEAGRSIEPGTDTDGRDIASLFRQLDIDAPGNIYIQSVTRGDDVMGVLVVASPLRQAELTPSETELLQALAIVAGQLLFWQQQAETPPAFPDTDETAAAGTDASDHDVALAQIRRTRSILEGGLQQTLQDIEKLRDGNAELLIKLDEERAALLKTLGDDAEAITAAQKITSIFDEQTRLREANDTAALDLLERETALRTLAADSDAELRQVILDFVQKSHDLQVDSRARLQSQLDALDAKGELLAAAEAGDLVEALTDLSLRLEREGEALASRHADLLSESEAIGMHAELGNFAQVLIQHYATSSTLQNAATAIARQRDNLQMERNQASAIRSKEMDSLRGQLDRITADHEQLLDQREDMRRAYEDLQSDLEAKAYEAAHLADKSKDLRQELSASAAQRDQLKEFIVKLTEERDNLLRIRDQLTNRLANALEGDDEPDETTLQTEASELRTLVNDLTGQREKLEAELRSLRDSRAGDAQVLADEETATPHESAADANILQKEITRLLGELKSPVTAIMDGADLLLAERIGILGAAQLQVLQNVSNNVTRFIEIIEELRQVSKISRDSFELNYSEADLVALLDDSLGKLGDLLRRKALSIDLSLGDALPKIPMDTRCIGRILDQLLANACEVSAQGSRIQLTLEVSHQNLPGAKGTADSLHLQVKDRGGGIDPHDIERLFARRYSSENPKIKGYSDNGVGLTVAQALARAHGGDVWITSESGDGSTIHLALPISPSSTTEA